MGEDSLPEHCIPLLVLSAAACAPASPGDAVCPPQPQKAPTDQPSKGPGALPHTAEPHTPPRAPGAAQPYLGDSELLGMKAKSRRGKKSLGPIIPKPLVRFGCILQGVGERCGGCQPCRAGSSVRPPPSSPHWAGSRLTGSAARAGGAAQLPKLPSHGPVQPRGEEAAPWHGAGAADGAPALSPWPGGLSASRSTPLTAGLPQPQTHW